MSISEKPDQQSIEQALERRVLILAPSIRDADVLGRVLSEAGITTKPCVDAEELCRDIEHGAAGGILAEEALSTDVQLRLAETLSRQPEWSDFPVIVIAGDDEAHCPGRPVLESVIDTMHAVLLPRPIQTLTLISSVRAAIRSRSRQYQMRDELALRSRAEQETGGREEQFRELGENIPQLAWMMQPDGWIFWYNQRWYEYTGTTLEQMRGWGWRSVHHPQHVDRVVKKFKRAIETGEPWEDTFPLRGRDGRYRWFLSRAFPIRDSAGRITRWFGTNTDVTDVLDVQSALRKSERRLSTLMSNLPGMAYRRRHDQDWTMEFVSDGVRAICGYGPDDLTSGKVAWTEIIHPDDVKLVRERMRAGLQMRRPYQMEYRIRHQDGTIRWVWEQGEAIFEEGEGPVALEGYVADITVRKREEEARAFLAAIIQSTDDAVVSKSLDGRITSWNGGAERLFGYTAAEAVGQRIHLIIPPELHDEEWSILDRIRQGKPIEHYETARIRKDGHRIDVSLTVSPILDNAGRVIGASKVARDITERIRAEEALRKSEERLRAAQEAGGVGTFEWDFRDNRHYWSPEIEGLYGLPPGGFDGTYEAWTALIHPEDLDRAEADIRRSLAGDEMESEWRVRLPDGRVRWLEARGWVDRDPNGRPVRMLGVNVDITDRKRHEEQMRTAMAELNHRVKNSIATIDAVAQQTLQQSKDLPSFQKSFSARLRSMAAAHSLLTRTEWQGTQLREILLAELTARVTTPDHLVLDGPGILIQPYAALSLHMAIHELTTNASKYGSLSVPGGRVHISWHVVTTDGGQTLEMVWKEQGGPAIAEPRKSGFGSQLIRDMVEFELNGSVGRRFEPDGLRCHVRFPLAGIGSVTDPPGGGDTCDK